MRIPIDRERLKQLLPCIQAYTEGKTIQYRSGDNKPWKDIILPEVPEWYDTLQYRVKPEAVVHKAWFNTYFNTYKQQLWVSSGSWHTEADARICQERHPAEVYLGPILIEYEEPTNV